MLDQDKSKQELIEELAEMRRRVAVLETADTDPKQAEAGLRESEERFRKVFEEGPMGILLVGTDGRIQHVNRRFREMLGYSEEEIIALGIAGISHPDDWKRDRPLVSRLWHGESSYYHAEKRYFHKDGRMVWAQLTISLMRDKAGRPINTVGMVEDITGRKQAEEELAKSKAVIQAAIDCLPFNFFAIGLDGRYMLQNAVSRAHQGGDAIGKLPEEVCQNQHDLAIWLDNNRRAFAGEKVEGEVTLSFGGEERFYYNIIAPIRDGEELLGILGVNIDITERKRAEEALQKAHDELEQRVQERTAELAKANEELAIFRKFAEASREGFGMSDFDGRIVYANPTLCGLYGEEKQEDVIGKNVSAYYPAEYLQRRKGELIPALLREGHFHVEQTVLPRHGKPIQTLQSTFLIRDVDGSPLRIAVVISDITERKQAEEALRVSEEHFRVTFEEAPVGMVIGVDDGTITKANRALCRMSGYSQEELVGRHVRDLTHPEDRELSGDFVKELLAGEISSFTLEKRYLRKDGQPFWAQATTAMAHKPDGKIAFALGVVEDITERKQAQEALQRQHQTLKHLLQSSDHERQLIAYEIHDGLAQELAGAIMQFDAFDHLKNSKPKQAADAYHAGMTMLRQGHSEARRLIAGVRPPILDEEGIAAAIGHLVNEQIRLKGPKIKYHSRVEFDRLDPTLENAIYRIAQEAFTNACTHSKSERISVSLLQRGDHLRIEVRDWGVGFDPKTVPKNHFGLEGIRQRAKLLGGKCSIRSKAGKGTSISVELPVVLRDDEG